MIAPEENPNVSSELSDQQLDFLLPIIDAITARQYERYSFADTKISILVTTNSILLATIGFLYKDCLENIWSTVFIAIALLAISVSMVFSLIKITPKLSSGRGAGRTKNLKAQSGILSFKTWQDYRDQISKLDKTLILEFGVRQIYGMSSNVEKWYFQIRVGVYSTAIGVIFIVLSFFSNYVLEDSPRPAANQKIQSDMIL